MDTHSTHPISIRQFLTESPFAFFNFLGHHFRLHFLHSAYMVITSWALGYGFYFPLPWYTVRMSSVLLPVLYISFSQFLIPYHKQVLGIVLFGSLCEIEWPRDHRLSINDHHFVVSYRVLSIYFHRDPLVIEKGGWWIFLCPLALVQDDFYLDSSLVGIQQGFSN